MKWNETIDNTTKEMLLILVAALAIAMIMGSLDAFDKLYRFTRAFEPSTLDDLSVFFPSFLALGFALYSYHKIQELELEIGRRKEVEKALLESERVYKELSITDDLTKLYNARHFSAMLREEIQRVVRYERKLSLMLIDVDDFKKYNDTFGHFDADLVLAKLGEVITDSLRRIDSAYRYGGEEFTVILPETAVKDAVNTAERIRSAFESEVQHLSHNEKARSTISIGVTQYTPKEDIQILLRRVDSAMYMAKEDGKNRVRLL